MAGGGGGGGGGKGGRRGRSEGQPLQQLFFNRQLCVVYDTTSGRSTQSPGSYPLLSVTE